MADSGYMERGKRRKKRGTRREWQERDYDRYDDSNSQGFGQAPAKHPIILAKPNRPLQRDSPGLSDDYASSPKSEAVDEGQSDIKSMTVLQSKESKPYATSAAQSIPSMLAGDSAHHVYQVQKRPQAISTSSNGDDNRLSFASPMDHYVKLVDEDLMWCDAGNATLQDQMDFLVVGALGLQGAGKSSLLSHLAHYDLNPKSYVFPAQSTTVREVCSHQTAGVDLFVCTERTFLLDTQPVLSASVLDQLIQQDLKHLGEYTSIENCMEIQSLQLASFLFTVCNTVLVVMDGFSDSNIFKFLQTAEMLKPQTPQPQDPQNKEWAEIYPNIVFVVNNAERDLFKAPTYERMQAVIARLMGQSNLKYKGVCTMGSLIPGLNPDAPHCDVNLFLIPRITSTDPNSSSESPLTTEFKGHPGHDVILKSLLKRILAMPRHLLTHTTLSEKNWFHYSARSWEAVKKSSLMAEYNRLLQ